MRKIKKNKSLSKSVLADVPVYTVVIKTNGMEFSGAGKTFEEAIAQITPPKKITTKTIVCLTIGGVTKERMIRAWQVAKLFHPNPLMREIVLKNFKIIFGLKND